MTEEQYNRATELRAEKEAVEKNIRKIDASCQDGVYKFTVDAPTGSSYENLFVYCTNEDNIEQGAERQPEGIKAIVNAIPFQLKSVYESRLKEINRELDEL